MLREDAAQAEKKTPLVVQWMKIAGVVSAYWVISISMVFLNKHLLSSKDLKLDAPIFITLSQCVVAVLCFVALGTANRYGATTGFPSMEFSVQTAVKVMPLSVIFVSMIMFNNLTLKFLGVAFYNVGRSLTTVFNVLFSYAVLSQTISPNIFISCAVIVCGFLLGIKEEDASTKLSIFGLVCGILASLSVALYAIYTKRTLPYVDSNIWRLQFFNNFNAVLLLAPLVLIMGEAPVLWDFAFWTSPSFWGMMLTAGLFGIAIGYVSTLQIQVTSPLTHNISGTAKAGAQTVLACMVYSESKPLWWWLSNVMVLFGSSAYTYVRMSEMTNGERGGGGGGGGGREKTLQILEGGGSEDKETL